MMAPTQLKYMGKPRTLRDADSSIIDWTKTFQSEAESQLHKRFGTFEAVKFTTEVLAGSYYRIKVNVGDGQYIHMSLFKPLPNSNEVEKLVQIEEGKTLEDELKWDK